MRQRLREQAGPGIDYRVARSNETWPDHRLRTLTTAGMIAWYKPVSVMDPACGDGSIVAAADRLYPIQRAFLSDVSSGSIGQLQNLIGRPDRWTTHVDSALDAFARVTATYSDVDVIVLTEFLEHVPDPETYLRLARQLGHYLVASSPLIEAPKVDENEEHLWAFDNEGYHELLVDAGWEPQVCQNLLLHSYYNFQIWACG